MTAGAGGRQPAHGGTGKVQALLGVSRVIDAVNERLGKWVAWLILLAVIISTGNAVVRKVFDTSSNAYLEMQWILFGAVFMLCSPWTLLSNEHIRIDIVNSLLPKTARNIIELIGHTLFLLPFSILMVWISWPFFYKSFIINEQSMNAGGLPQWPPKFLIFAGFVFLTVQGVSELIKRIAVMRGLIPDPHAGGGHFAAAEEEAKRIAEAARIAAEKAAADAADTRKP
jgi:TRAP-type mannitol/chloroaromatic compound transport system permease small subunit